MGNQLLKSKNAVIFGAKGALGRQTARVFKQHGANVYLSDIQVTGESEECESGKILRLDSTDEKQVDLYFKWFEKKGIAVDIVINFSSIDHAKFKHCEPTVTLSSEEFLIPMRVNITSQFISAKAAYSLMSRQKSGVIIFITSTLAKAGAPFTAALSASHAAAEGLVRALASEWGPEGIRVVGVRSGAMTDTPTIKYTFRQFAKAAGMTEDEVYGFVNQRTSLKRATSTEETANVLVLAASDMTKYMAGTILNTSGGEILE